MSRSADHGDVALTDLELVEELGRLRRQLAGLVEREVRLSAVLEARMAEHGLDRLESDRWSCRLIDGRRVKINPVRLFERVRREDFLAAVTVSVAEARRLLGENEILSISELTPYRQIRIEERK